MTLGRLRGLQAAEACNSKQKRNKAGRPHGRASKSSTWVEQASRGHSPRRGRGWRRGGGPHSSQSLQQGGEAGQQR